MSGVNTIDKILAGLAIISTIMALGVFVYTEMIYQRPIPDEKAELVKLEEDIVKANNLETFKFKKKIVNLVSNRTRLRYLSFEMYALPYSSKDLDTLKESTHLVYDVAIDEASRLGPNEINTLTGRMLLENRIKERSNKRLKKEMIKKLYFSSFIVQ